MFTRSEKLLLFVLALINFSHIVDFMIIMPLSPQLIRVLGISPQQFSLLVSSYAFSACVSGLAGSLFLDRVDRKKSLLVYYAGFAVSNLFCALSTQYETLLVSRIVAGFFGGSLSAQLMSILGDQIPPQKRGTATGVVMMSFSLASLFGVPFSLKLSNMFNWEAPFLFIVAVSALAIVFAFISLPNMVGHLHNNKTSSLKTLLSVVQNPNHVNAAIFISLVVFSQFLIIPFFSQALVANKFLTEAELPLIYLFGGVVSIVNAPLMGRLSDKFGKLTVLNIMIPVSFVAFYFATSSLMPNKVFVILMVCFFFFAMGGRVVPSMALVTGAVKMEQRGTFMSLQSSAQQFAMSLSAAIAGIIVQKGTNGELLHFEIVGYLAIVVSVFAWAMAQRIKSVG